MKTERIEITDKIREKLISERKRTGVGSYVLLRGNPVKGLTSATVNQWVSGKVKMAGKIKIDAVFKLYSDLPTVEIVPLTLEKAKEIKNRIRETGLSLDRLLRTRNDVPHGLKGKHFYNTLCPPIGNTYNKLWGDYVVRICEEYIELKQKNDPQVDKVADRANPKLQAISTDKLKKLQGYNEAIKGYYAKLFENSKVPQNLTPNMVKNWVVEQTKTALPEHVDWVLDRSAEILSEALAE
ncbi:MAG: hypothetical protein AAFZ92_10550 [Pseudomonadota bacterium]